MTDPRIEEAAWMIGSVSDLAPGGDWEKLTPYQKTHFRRLAKAVLEAADAAAWRPIETAPKDGTDIIACGTQTFDAGCDPEPFINIIFWSGNMWQDGTIADQPKPTHWQPLPTRPNATPQAAPDTITIPEVRNDRPIPGKEGADG
ncbi:hypothetical protein JK182_09810 [Acetobacter okinawensis]|uniref:hypothetical protein n=1 Tax=Acetobacter okinawensis TaxID=1076594 RepID=UPI001BAB4F4F|nr:hypothetical protein [Acetobacter okinawensis]MBS0988955.1 hypothetical protein [Acetobacter okinawensis]